MKTKITLFLVFVMCVYKLAPGQVLYNEPYRPQYHFTTEKNWINDPCGTVFFDGKYHLMFQYNPFGDQWGNMSWGHAVSTDLVHWEELPVALAPDPLGDIFTGSAVVDVNNTAGFGANAMIAVFTHAGPAGQQQSLAYSTNGGTDWIKYVHNPVLSNPGVPDFRDPQVFWYGPTSRWIMTLAVKDRIHIYASPDLKSWTFESEFGAGIGAHGGVWECPDFFPLKVEGTGLEKWVMMVSLNPGGIAGGSGMQYFVGDFDGHTFTPDSQFTKEQQIIVPEGLVFSDFESGYNGWSIEGNAFGTAPAQGTLANQQQVSGFLGGGLVNTFLNGDDSQGKIISPEFIIDTNYINFLIGGGNRENEAEIRLIINNTIARRTTGRNQEQLLWSFWDVETLKGMKARIEIVDAATGGWGHINVDHIVFSNAVAVNKPIGYWVDFGPDFYAARTWDSNPSQSEPRVWVGWLNNWSYAGSVPTSPFRGAISLPRSLSLQQFGDETILIQQPIAAMSVLRNQERGFSSLTITQANQWLLSNGISGKEYEIEMTLASSKDISGIKVRQGEVKYTSIAYDKDRHVVSVDRSKSGLMPYGAFHNVFESPELKSTEDVKLKIFVDRSSVEVFVNDGEAVFTSWIFPYEDGEGLEFFGGSDVVIKDFKISSAKSIWREAITSVDENEAEIVMVFPNPSSGKWIIDTLRNHNQYELYANDGSRLQLYARKLNRRQVEISTLENLQPGVYYLKIFDKNKIVESRKVLVK